MISLYAWHPKHHSHAVPDECSRNEPSRREMGVDESETDGIDTPRIRRPVLDPFFPESFRPIRIRTTTKTAK